MSLSSQRLIDAALLSPPYSTLSYAPPPWLPESVWRPGMRVLLPLGRGCRVAVVLGLRQAERGTIPEGLKYALWPLETEPLLDAAYLELVRQLGVRHAVPPGRILGTVLPSPLRLTKGRFRFLGEGKARECKTSELAAFAGDLTAGSACPAELRSFGELWLQGRGSWLEGGDSPLDREMVSLAQDPPWPVRPRAFKQFALLDYLLLRGAVSKRQLLDDLGSSASETLNTLMERQLVLVRPRDEGESAGAGVDSGEAAGEGRKQYWNAPFALSPDQDAALAALVADSDPAGGSGAKPHLLHGVTGSGKTAVYLALAAACLERGRSVMLLAPEVALAIKLRRDAERYLKDAPVIFYHGYQTPRERQERFVNAASAGPVLIVGTRSALFLPVRNLGAIILDEEHDTSFKQDEGLVYQAKEVAWFRAAQGDSVLLLGSATPDVKTYYAAGQGQIRLHALSERTGGGTLPSIRLVALPRSSPGAGLLAGESIEAIAACVARGEQAVILLNRRGYAPFMYCTSCGGTVHCPHCDISLTYHKGRERLVCHYCGHAVPFPSPCPDCGGVSFVPMGEGTEKLEESLLPFLPVGSRILRLDRDSTRRPGRMEEILAAFGRGEASVLVGTQMLSKGHHFPNVTLVVAADADLGLNLPDYRAAERSFQLVLQAAGRSGRGEKPGEVLIQTRDPGHYCWEFVRGNDYEGFYAQEVALRERRRYPPFVRLALIRLSFPMDWNEGMARLEKVAEAIRGTGKARGVSVLGPAPAPLSMIKGMRRFHCLLKSDNWVALRDIYGAALRAAGQSKLRVG
ncbi:primosomal protein N', partial [Desulfovibrio sp. OttesenSCG-928-I05]|nr:primosomal protein N' [Desulfovibrio sp. OttesenSCG-928-I05]